MRERNMCCTAMELIGYFQASTIKLAAGSVRMRQEGFELIEVEA